LGLLLNDSEYLFQTRNLALGLTAMLLEGSPQLVIIIMGSFRHFRQRRQYLLSAK
jgi:hypothetical protein